MPWLRTFQGGNDGGKEKKERVASTHITNVRAQKIDCHTLILKTVYRWNVVLAAAAAALANTFRRWSQCSFFVMFSHFFRVCVYFFVYVCSGEHFFSVRFRLAIWFHFHRNICLMDQRCASIKMNIVIYSTVFFFFTLLLFHSKSSYTSSWACWQNRSIINMSTKSAQLGMIEMRSGIEIWLCSNRKKNLCQRI